MTYLVLRMKHSCGHVMLPGVEFLNNVIWNIIMNSCLDDQWNSKFQEFCWLCCDNFNVIFTSENSGSGTLIVLEFYFEKPREHCFCCRFLKVPCGSLAQHLSLNHIMNVWTFSGCAIIIFRPTAGRTVIFLLTRFFSCHHLVTWILEVGRVIIIIIMCFSSPQRWSCLALMVPLALRTSV